MFYNYKVLMVNDESDYNVNDCICGFFIISVFIIRWYCVSMLIKLILLIKNNFKKFDLGKFIFILF